MENIFENITSVVFGLICHQDSSFLLTVDGREVLLCPRCMGLQIGFLSSYLFLWCWVRGRTTIVEKLAYVTIVISLGALTLDWAGGHLGFWIPTSNSRLITGLAGGVAFSTLTYAYRRKINNSIRLKPHKFTAVNFVLLFSFSLLVGLALVRLSGWPVLSSALLLTVTINSIIIIHKIFIVTGSHLSRRLEIQTLKKGALS